MTDSTGAPDAFELPTRPRSTPPSWGTAPTLFQFDAKRLRKDVSVPTLVGVVASAKGAPLASREFDVLTVLSRWFLDAHEDQTRSARAPGAARRTQRRRCRPRRRRRRPPARRRRLRRIDDVQAHPGDLRPGQQGALPRARTRDRQPQGRHDHDPRLRRPTRHLRQPRPVEGQPHLQGRRHRPAAAL